MLINFVFLLQENLDLKHWMRLQKKRNSLRFVKFYTLIDKKGYGDVNEQDRLSNIRL